MSTLFVPNKPLSFEAIRTFDRDGVRSSEDEEDSSVILTDGKSCLTAYPPTDGWPVTFERCGNNDPSAIIAAIEKAYGVVFVSEHDEEFEELRGKSK